MSESKVRAALRELLGKADQLIYRPAVDDSRTIDRHTLELRVATINVRPVLSQPDPAEHLAAALRELLAVEQNDNAKGTQEWCERASRAMDSARAALAAYESGNFDGK